MGKLESLLWPASGGKLPWLDGVLRKPLQYLYALIRDVATGPLTLHAMGLVYVTILSLVPLLAVSFSVLKAFGFHRQMMPLLHEFLSPLGGRGNELAEKIIGFVDNAQSDVLAGLGVLFLFLAAISMAEQVEGSFNQIWRVERPRSFGRRVSEYLSVILVGPLVMLTSMSLIASLRGSSLLQHLPGSSLFTRGHFFSEITPYLIVCLGFSFVYWFVPNTRVRGRAAAIGGLVGGVLWAGTGAVFAAFVVNSAATISIYATFAIVISALLWLYLCWLILLIGSQVAFYVQNDDYLRIGYRRPVTGTGQREQTALAIMVLTAHRFRAGSGSTSLPWISETIGLPGIMVSPVVRLLEAAGLVARTAEDGLMPGRDPARIQLREIIAAVRNPAGADSRHDIPWPGAMAAVSRRLEEAQAAALGEETLESLITERQAPYG